MLKKLSLLILASSFLVTSPVIASEIVKKSSSKICHDKSSPAYERTTNFKPYSSMKTCLDSGGRLPKNAAKSKTKTSDSKYSRKKFGSGWSDADRDCQNSRMEALISQSVGPIKYKSKKECKVLSGRWNSPYSDKTIYKASDIDIDHVIPLKWAWDHGADKWPKKKRVKIANDPANLLSVEASLNRQKGAKGLDKWLPPKNQCQYIARFERVRKTYGLKLSTSEKKKYASVREKHCG